MLDKIISIIMCLSTLISVCVSAYAISQSKRQNLTATYFSNMADAYSTYMESVAKFVYAPCDSTRDSLSCALYRVMLYASNDVCEAAQVVFDKAIDFSRSDRSSALRVDTAVNEMGVLMRQDLDYFRCSAGRS